MITLDQGGQLRASARIIRAPAAIEAFVDFLWVDDIPRCPSPSAASPSWRVVADDAPHIMYVQTTDGRDRLSVVGARTIYTDIQPANRTITTGARLRPGALAALLGEHATHLTDRAEPLSTFVPGVAQEALHRLRDASPVCSAAHANNDDDKRHADYADHTSRAAAYTPITGLIAQLARRARPLDLRAQWLHALPRDRTLSVRAIANEFAISDRALRLWSVAHLGVGVKRFLRIRRLHLALDTRLRHPHASWSTIAARAGFADHAHLVRDCQALVGESPSAFLARRTIDLPFHSSRALDLSLS